MPLSIWADQETDSLGEIHLWWLMSTKQPKGLRTFQSSATSCDQVFQYVSHSMHGNYINRSHLLVSSPVQSDHGRS